MRSLRLRVACRRDTEYSQSAGSKFAPFPLILTFSLGEKEPSSAALDFFVRPLANPVADFRPRRKTILPLPEGEGRGEGERSDGCLQSVNQKGIPLKPIFLPIFLGCTLLFGSDAFCRDRPAPTGPQTDGAFHKVVLDPVGDTDLISDLSQLLREPMELAVARDGRVFYAERGGLVKMWDPQTKTHSIIAKIKVENFVVNKMEDGLLGLVLDPNFEKNNWIYLYYSPPQSTNDNLGRTVGENLLSRFTLKGNQLDLESEKVLLHVPMQRYECCHSGGDLAFDSKGNLYLSTGDNTNPFTSDGFAPMDERPGVRARDAQRTSANSADLRGKILRVTPQDDGTIKIPEGNLFKPGTPKTRPEIYVMGCRNPFRISLDERNGFLYWGDVGPDAVAFQEGRGPAGFDEINQARAAGNFGWPYFVSENRPYWKFDFKTKTSGEKFNPEKPINDSTNNTGIRELPPAQPSFISYANVPSIRFPEVNSGGGRCAMAGPVYYFNDALASPHKLPREFDHTLFIYDWSREWIIAVHLDQEQKIAKMERFCSGMTFKRPIEIKVGPDGCLYMMEWGTAWANNSDCQLERIEYFPPEK